jgi:hypothetical protein
MSPLCLGVPLFLSDVFFSQSVRGLGARLHSWLWFLATGRLSNIKLTLLAILTL